MAAREALARWCLPRVRRTVLLSYGPGPDAEDLAQTAMVKAFSRIESFRNESNFFVWVDKVTINVVRDHFRKKKLLVFGHDETIAFSPQLVDTKTPDSHIEGGRILENLAKHFAAMRPKRRLPLILSLLHGYTVSEIAAILDVSFDTAKKRLWHGRKEILRRVSKDPYCVQVLREMGR